MLWLVKRQGCPWNRDLEGEVELATQSPKSSGWGALRSRAEREALSTGLGGVAVVTKAYLT